MAANRELRFKASKLEGNSRISSESVSVSRLVKSFEAIFALNHRPLNGPFF